MVTRLTNRFYCEICLTPSLECVLQGLMNMMLILMWPNTMKYLPDNLLYSLFRQWHYYQELWPTLSTQGHIILRIHDLTRRMQVPRFLSYYRLCQNCLLIHLWDFPSGSDSKASVCNAGDLGLILGWEDPLEKEMTAHSSFLAWKIPWTTDPGRLPSTGSQRVWHDFVWPGFCDHWKVKVKVESLSHAQLFATP